MEQKWIDQFNKKCAEFLEITYNKGRFESPIQSVEFMLIQTNTMFAFIEDFETIIPEEHYQFHSDWNWIHVVVEKINDVILSKEHDEKETVLVFLRHNIRDYLGASLKIPVVRAINEFLDKHLEYYGN